MATEYPEQFFYMIKFIYNITGVWLFSPNRPNIIKYVKYSWTLLLHTVAISFIICELTKIKELVTDINKLITQMGLLLSGLFSLVKITILICHHKKLVEVTEIMQDEKYHYKAVGDFDPGKIMEEAKTSSSRFAKMCLVYYGFVGVSPHITSVMILNNEVNENHFTGNLTCYDFLPFTFYIPFPIHTKWWCHITLFYMDMAISGMALCITCHDVFFSVLLNCLRAQFVIVGEAFRTIRQRVLLRLHLPQNFEVFRDEEHPTLEEELYKEMNFTTKHFAMLLRVAEDLEEIFNKSVLGQTLLCLLVFATCIFVATTAPFTSPEFGAAAQCFTAVLSELALFCWFGSGVTRASEEMMFALYNCDWYSASKRFKSSLLITMSRLQEPVYFTLGKFGPLTLVSLVSVCRASFSYYTVLKSVNE